MRALLPGLLLMLLAACRSAGPAPEAAAPAPSVVQGDEVERPRDPGQRPPLNTELLPSITRTATLREAAALLQRPVVGSVILKRLAAGEVVQVLGTLDNAGGQWLSVGSEGMQGWLRASETQP